MHMDTQGLTTNLLGMDTSGEGEPVVRMDNVELLSTGYLTSNIE
jgi:hypothetical protein